LVEFSKSFFLYNDNKKGNYMMIRMLMAFMAMSLLTAFAAVSKWIGPMQGDKWKVTNPVPCFVKTFKLDSMPRSAVAKIAAAGWF
jgi:hypothetical protein